MLFKHIFIFSLWPVCSASRNSCAILVEGIMRNISLNYFEFLPVVQDISILSFGGHSVRQIATIVLFW